jgi:hypothetical protein
MTEQELQELSRRVAEKFGIPAKYENYPDVAGYTYTWLYQDLERVMRLAIEHGIGYKIYSEYDQIEAHINDEEGTWVGEKISEHPSREQAVIVAIMKALLEIEE